jgi:hypothetical protein
MPGEGALLLTLQLRDIVRNTECGASSQQPSAQLCPLEEANLLIHTSHHLPANRGLCPPGGGALASFHRGALGTVGPWPLESHLATVFIMTYGRKGPSWRYDSSVVGGSEIWRPPRLPIPGEMPEKPRWIPTVEYCVQLEATMRHH